MTDKWKVMEVKVDKNGMAHIEKCPYENDVTRWIPLTSQCLSCTHSAAAQYEDVRAYVDSNGDCASFPVCGGEVNKPLCCHPDVLPKQEPEVVPCGACCIYNQYWGKPGFCCDDNCNNIQYHKKVTTCPAYKRWLKERAGRLAAEVLKEEDNA